MIELDNLAVLHDDKDAIHRHKRLLEEIFHLCINETFSETIDDARVSILAMLNGINLDFPCDKETALQLRNGPLSETIEYRQLLNSISTKHGYYHPAFTRNYIAPDTDPDNRSKLNILENIIFLNDPVPEANPLDHFYDRSGFMGIAEDDINGPHIKIQFDIGTTKQEMINIIVKDFPETLEQLADEYNIPKTRYRATENLNAKAFIIKQTLLGDSDITIAAKLETEGLIKPQDNYDHVRMAKARMSEASSRFNPND